MLKLTLGFPLKRIKPLCVVHVLESRDNSILNEENLYSQTLQMIQFLEYLLLLLVLNFLFHPDYLILFSTSTFLACIALELGDPVKL